MFVKVLLLLRCFCHHIGLLVMLLASNCKVVPFYSTLLYHFQKYYMRNTISGRASKLLIDVF